MTLGACSEFCTRSSAWRHHEHGKHQGCELRGLLNASVDQRMVLVWRAGAARSHSSKSGDAAAEFLARSVNDVVHALIVGPLLRTVPGSVCTDHLRRRISKRRGRGPQDFSSSNLVEGGFDIGSGEQTLAGGIIAVHFDMDLSVCMKTRGHSCPPETFERGSRHSRWRAGFS